MSKVSLIPVTKEKRIIVVEIEFFIISPKPDRPEFWVVLSEIERNSVAALVIVVVGSEISFWSAVPSANASGSISGEAINDLSEVPARFVVARALAAGVPPDHPRADTIFQSGTNGSLAAV